MCPSEASREQALLHLHLPADKPLQTQAVHLIVCRLKVCNRGALPEARILCKQAPWAPFYFDLSNVINSEALKGSGAPPSRSQGCWCCTHSHPLETLMHSGQRRLLPGGKLSRNGIRGSNKSCCTHSPKLLPAACSMRSRRSSRPLCKT